MSIFVNILLALIPSSVLVFFFYFRDKHKRESPFLIFKIFLAGFLIVIPAIIIELVLGHFGSGLSGIPYLLIKAFVIAAFVEEGLKLAVIKVYVFPKKDFDEVVDGIVFTITASMGFAFFENILYTDGPSSVLILRGFTAVLLHASASGIMGYYIGMSKSGQDYSIRKGFLAAVLIHGLYDFFLFTETLLAYLIIPLLIISIIILLKLFKKALDNDLKSGRSRKNRGKY